MKFLKDILDLDPPRIEVLDIGAMIEGADRYTPLVEQGIASVTGFEPQDDKRAELEARNSAHRYLPYFLGPGGKATFHVCRFPGCSSIYEPDPSVIDLFATIGASGEGNFAVIDVVDIETKRLDDIDDCPSPDFAKLDIQGAELEALKGGVAKLAATVVMEIEVCFLPLYRDQPLFGEVQMWMRGQGFVLHKLIDVAGRTFRPIELGDRPFVPISQMLWADAIFVRDFSALERWPDDALIKGAIVLFDLYRSSDLVARLLLEHDARTGGDVGARFLTHISETGMPAPRFLNIKKTPS